MNRSRFLLPVLLAVTLALGACSKTNETGSSSKPAASADQGKRTPTVEIVASEGKARFKSFFARLVQPLTGM